MQLTALFTMPRRATKMLAMKLMAIMLVVSLQVSAGASSQTVTYSAKNARLETVFNAIRQQTGYVFFYKANVLKDAKPVNLDVKNVPIERVLQLCLDNQGLGYTIEDKTIVIAAKEEKRASGTLNPGINFGFDVVPPPIKIKVLDSTGAPLPGATVALKNKILGVTDAEGMFTLNANAGDIINVSFVGYRSRQVSITSSILSSPNTLIIALVPVVDMLQDVTVEVNTGYQEINRNHITGSYSVLNNKAFNRTVSSDVLSRMKGMVAGVLFDKNTGDPTGIAVRNRNTINSSTKPLIIVDNFPYNLDLNSLNPNDIESITVLKDAASAAIWGAFSSNGVIIITTKKGKYNQRLRVNVNSNFTVGEKPDLFYDRTFLDSKTMLEVENFLYGKGHYVADINNTFNYPMISPGVEIYDKLSKGLLTSSEADSKLAALSMNDIRRDYNKYFYRQSLTQQYAINLNGGSEKMNYFASLGYDKSYANVVGNESERLTLNSNFTFEPTSFAELNGGVYIANSRSVTNGIERIVGGNKYSNNIYPYATLVDKNNNPATVYKDFNNEFIENLPVKGLLDWRYNPLLDRQYNDKRSNGLENRLFTSLKLSIIKGLSAEFKYQYQKSVAGAKTLLGKQSYYVRDLVNRYSKIQQDSVVGYNIPYGDILTSTNVSNTSNQGRAQLNYNNSFDDLAIVALIGVDYTQTKVNAEQNTFYNYNPETGSFGLVDYITPFPTYPTQNPSSIPSLGDGISPYKLDRYRSYFFNSNYTYNNKYTLSLSARLDQSNLFGVRTNQKTVPLWSIGGRWDAYKENFFKASWIDNFVVRSSFGYRGNVNRSITAFTLIQNIGNERLNNLPYSLVIFPGNRDLRWEKVQTLNAGIDLSMLNNRINVSFDFYKTKGIDLIGDLFLPSSTGFLTGRGNYAEMKGQGFDLSINTKNIDRIIKWNTTFMISHAKDKITKNEGNTFFVVGKPVASIFSYKWAGLDDAGDPLGYLGDTVSKNYGTIINRHAQDRSLFVASNIAPQLFGSVLNTFSYKGVNLSVNLIYKLKYYFRRSSISYSALFGSGIGNVDYYNRWQQKGDEVVTNVPALVYSNYPQFNNRETFYSQSDVLVERGDHIRIQDISLSYDIRNPVLKSMKIESLQLYVYANNIGLVWKANKSGIDPDNQSGYPVPRTYSIGMRVGF